MCLHFSFDNAFCTMNRIKLIFKLYRNLDVTKIVTSLDCIFGFVVELKDYQREDSKMTLILNVLLLFLVDFDLGRRKVKVNFFLQVFYYSQ